MKEGMRSNQVQRTKTSRILKNLSIGGLIIGLLLFALAPIQAQSTGEPANAVLIVPSFAIQFPGGDMKDRFGWNSSVGGKIGYKFGRNWFIGPEMNFIFGTKVKEDGILDSITTENGLLVNINGNPLGFGLFERGFSARMEFGKVFALNSAHPNSGILFSLGVGVLQHKIFINIAERDVPQLSDDFKAGYDRRSRGFTMSQFLGYQFLRQEKLVSFYAGIELIQGFTQNTRAIDFDLGVKDEQKRKDFLVGLKIGWIIPVFGEDRVEKGTEFYYR